MGQLLHLGTTSRPSSTSSGLVLSALTGEKIVLGTWDDGQWVQAFHMHWAIFMDTVAQLAPNIACQDVSMQPPRLQISK